MASSTFPGIVGHELKQPLVHNGNRGFASCRQRLAVGAADIDLHRSLFPHFERILGRRHMDIERIAFPADPDFRNAEFE